MSESNAGRIIFCTKHNGFCEQKQKILLQQHLKAKGIAVTDLDDDAEVGAEVLRDVMMGEPALMSDITQEPFPSDMFSMY